jgi:RimJ/RimL family protein N-acetyltransferase
MTLRAAALSDLAPIRAAVATWWGGRDLSPLLPSLFLENFSSTSLILEDDDACMIGFLVGFPSLDDPESAYVHFIGIAPEHRGRGLGRSLHAAFAERMSTRGVVTIRCVTSPLNTDSVAFHEAVGFEIESAEDDLIHFVRTIPASPVRQYSDPRPHDAPWPEVLWPVPADTELERGEISLTLARQQDTAELFLALDDDRVWTHVRGRPASADDLAAGLGNAMAAGRWPWIVRERGHVVGTTSYLEVSPVDARIEIGFTLYSPDVWGGDVNPTCKLLLMQWAFEVASFGRVQLKTDIRNARSQGAIARLGARPEGVLRRYQRRQDLSVRDTVVYSVIAEEWPDVKKGLIERLAAE